MDLSWHFLSIEDEIKNKNLSLLTPTQKLESDFLVEIEKRFGFEGLKKVQKGLDFFKGCSSLHKEHPPLSIYLSHPLRVAYFTLLLQPRPTLDSVLVALFHNFYEITDLNESDLQGVFTNSQEPNWIRLLTIDRKNQENQDYLKKFYGDITAQGEVLTLIRCLDKLDNLLGIDIFENNPSRLTYVNLADQFMTPMAFRVSEKLGRFFSGVIEVCRIRKPDEEFKAKYDNLILEARS